MFRYLRKVFEFASHLATCAAPATTSTSRPPPSSKPSSTTFVFRLPSFLQLQAELAAESHLRLPLGLDRPFGDDTLPYRFASFELEPLEQMLVTLNRRLKRNKAFNEGRAASLPLWTGWRRGRGKQTLYQALD